MGKVLLIMGIVICAIAIGTCVVCEYNLYTNREKLKNKFKKKYRNF